MFENFAFSNVLKPDNLMAGGSMLANMGQGMQNGGGLLGAMQGGGGGMGGLLQNKQVLDMLKKLMAQQGGGGLLGGAQQMVGKPMGLMGNAPLAPWGGGTY